MKAIRRYKAQTKVLNALFISLGVGMYGSLMFCGALAVIQH